MSNKTPPKIAKHPVQPVIEDIHGVWRFKHNQIVNHLLEHGGIDLNQIACLSFSKEDRAQFAQLIGYSVSGYSELCYSDSTEIDAIYKSIEKGIDPKDALIKTLQKEFKDIKDNFRKIAVKIFNISPEDLE